MLRILPSQRYAGSNTKIVVSPGKHREPAPPFDHSTIRPFDRLMVVSKVEPQTQGSEEPRTTAGADNEGCKLLAVSVQPSRLKEELS
ncbi:MAG: hypothetical protein V3U06_10865 [Candidatus Binatia bacterium]